MRYETLKNFFADTRRYLDLAEISDQWVERPLRQAMAMVETAAGTEKTGQWGYKQSAIRTVRPNR